MVHLSTDPNLKNKIAVIGVLYKIGKPDKFLSKVTADTLKFRPILCLLLFSYAFHPLGIIIFTAL